MTTQGMNPHVVIVGGGFGGLETVRRLRKADVRITIVDRHNYYLIQPLLYQVATGVLSPANIVTPLSAIVRKQANCEVLLAQVTDFDLANQKSILADGELGYDILVIAAGATHSYFGCDDRAKFAPGLKTITDAIEIRRRIYVALEAAESEPDPETRSAMLTFVIVDGGPTGVELAGALSEIARHTLKHDFRHINPEDARIMIVEAAPHILAHYPKSYARARPRRCERWASKSIRTPRSPRNVPPFEDMKSSRKSSITARFSGSRIRQNSDLYQQHQKSGDGSYQSQL